MQKYQTLNLNNFTTSDYNRLTNEIIDNKIKEKELFKKSNTCGFINNFNLDIKIAAQKTK